MTKITITSEQKTALELRHKRARDSRESDRIKAVLLRSEGWETAKIAQALRIHETTVLRHLDDYLSENKLHSASGGSSSSLDSHQTAELIAHLTEHTYCYANEIAAYIYQCWSIKYSIPGINNWLHQHGFSYKNLKAYPTKLISLSKRNSLNII